MHKKVIVALLAGSLLFTACGGAKKATIADQMGASYIIENAESSGKYTQHAYRASSKQVEAVVQEIAEKKKPYRITKSDPEHMFMLYIDQVIHVQRDPILESDAIIEIDSLEYFVGNYSPYYLAQYIEGEDMALLFGDKWKQNAQYKKQSYYGHADFQYRKKYPKLTYPGQYKPKTKAVKTVDPSKMAEK